MEEKHCKWYNDEFCTNDKSPCVADYCPVVQYPDLCKHRETELDKDINVRSKLTDEEKLEYGGFIEVTMEDMKNMHRAPTVDEVIKALECCKSKEKKCKECALHEFGSGCLDVLIANSHCIVQIGKSEIDRKSDVIDWLSKDIESLKAKLDEFEEQLSARQNELWDLQDDFDNRLADETRKTVQELLQSWFYFLDGNSFWLAETGNQVHYVKLDDALEFMRKKAKQYFVEVE